MVLAQADSTKTAASAEMMIKTDLEVMGYPFLFRIDFAFKAVFF